MQLKSISFVENAGTENEWRLKTLEFGSLNLIVGRNATGKSRTLNIIVGLADLVRGRKQPTFGHTDWNIELSNGAGISYKLVTQDEAVEMESFAVNGKQQLTRKSTGEAEIYAEQLKTNMKFGPPPNQLVVSSRRDKVQHTFLEPLHEWAQAVRYYPFGTPLGKESFVVFLTDPNKKSEIDLNDFNKVVAIFKRGEKEFPDTFAKSVTSDMAAIGYDLEDISIKVPLAIRFNIDPPLSGQPSGLSVKERELKGRTDQFSMSQGMFRALSIIIQLNYSELASKPSCILIDDVGEGLDYERSCALIELLMQKAKRTGVQLIMSTNDRFVMNKVPLEAWTVLLRDGPEIRAYNYGNAKAVFDDFKFTGLSNFDFFSSEFFKSISTNA